MQAQFSMNEERKMNALPGDVHESRYRTEPSWVLSHKIAYYVILRAERSLIG